MQDLAVIDEPTVASTVLDPVRSRILAALGEPGSATTVAKALGMSRQKANYHMRTLEDHGLIGLVEERPRRGLTERVMVASAHSYVVSPSILGHSSNDPAQTDRLSTGYLVALGARLVREVAEMARGAHRAQQPLATLAIDTEIRFGSAAERAAFTRELTQAVTGLATKYHDENPSSGRWHRLIVAAHPRPTPTRTPTKEAHQ